MTELDVYLPEASLSMPPPRSFRDDELFDTSSSRAPVCDRGHHYILALLSELEAISVFVAVSTSVANAAQQPLVLKVCRDALISYLPPDSLLASTAMPELLRSGAETEAIALMQSFQMRLALAKRMSVAFVAESSATTAGRTVLVDTLADAWQRTCASALHAIMSLRRSLPESTRMRLNTGPGRVVELLKAAQRGEHPCLEPDGVVVIPGWAERRRAKRARLDMSCAVRVGNRIMPATIHDISLGGMGIEGVTDVDRGAILEAELPTGRRLSGTIAWTSETRVGIKFNTPLSPGDPLLP